VIVPTGIFLNFFVVTDPDFWYSKPVEAGEVVRRRGDILKAGYFESWTF